MLTWGSLFLLEKPEAQGPALCGFCAGLGEGRSFRGKRASEPSTELLLGSEV